MKLCYITLTYCIYCYYTAPAVAVVNEPCRGPNEVCGGFVGFECCAGLDCRLEGDFSESDRSGVCVPPDQSCPTAGQLCGITGTGVLCCRGLECVPDVDFPTLPGICRTTGNRFIKLTY